MKNYFTHDGKKQAGPYTLQELKQMHITSDMYVWHDGLPQWELAGNISELNDLFTSTPLPYSFDTLPPPVELPYSSDSYLNLNQIKRKTPFRLFVFMVAIMILGIGAFVVIQNLNRVGIQIKNRSSAHTLNEITPAEDEKLNPKKFLKVNGYFKDKILSNKIKIMGTLQNKAIQTSYRDVVLRISYFDKSKTEIGKRNYTIHQIIGPSASGNFDIKAEYLENMHTLDFEIIDAIALPGN